MASGRPLMSSCRQPLAVLRGQRQQRLQRNGGRLAIALDIGDQLGRLVLGDADAGHAHVRVFGHERQRDRVLAGPHPLGAGDEVDQPGTLPAFGNAREIRPDPVAAADGVAAGADLDEQRLARRTLQFVGLDDFAAMLGNGRALGPARIHLVEHGDEALHVAHQRVALPLVGCSVAQQNVVAMLAEKPAAFAEPLADLVDVFRNAGEKQPAGTGAERLGVLLHLVGGVVHRIDADRIEEDVLADAVAKSILQLRHSRRRDRADIPAAREQEADDEDLVLDQVVIEVEDLAVLGDDRDVGHIVLAPAGGLRPATCNHKGEEDKRGAGHAPGVSR